MSVGGIWLFVFLMSSGLPEEPTRTLTIQRRYDTMAQCQRARSEILRQYPRAYARCD